MFNHPQKISLSQHLKKPKNVSYIMAQLLKQAYQSLAKAETHILEQDKRIKHLENMASTDELTKLLNRRGLEKSIQHASELLNRDKNTSSLFILIDLDLFKPINDTYGHPAGDACLKLVAETLQNLVRQTDTVARLGGDEFALLLTDIEEDDHTSKIKDINTALNTLTLKWNDHSIEVRCSIGTSIQTKETHFQDFYQSADASLYECKKDRSTR